MKCEIKELILNECETAKPVEDSFCVVLLKYNCIYKRCLNGIIEMAKGISLLNKQGLKAVD